MQVGQNPPLAEKDPHWFIGVPDELPYTVASLPYRTAPLETTGELLMVPEAKQRVVPSLCGGSRSNLASLSNLSNLVRRLHLIQHFILVNTEELLKDFFLCLTLELELYFLHEANKSCANFDQFEI